MTAAPRLEDLTTHERVRAALALYAGRPIEDVPVVAVLTAAGISLMDTAQLALVLEDMGTSYRLAVGGVDKAAEANTEAVALREWQRRAAPILETTASDYEATAANLAAFSNPLTNGNARAAARLTRKACAIRALLAEVAS